MFGDGSELFEKFLISRTDNIVVGREQTFKTVELNNVA